MLNGMDAETEFFDLTKKTLNLNSLDITAKHFDIMYLNPHLSTRKTINFFYVSNYYNFTNSLP